MAISSPYELNLHFRAKLKKKHSKKKKYKLELEYASNSFSMRINPKKIKVTSTTKDPNLSLIHILVSVEEVKQVTMFIYLDCLLSSDHQKILILPR